VWVLNSHDVECLAIGAGILGCGGGGDPNIGQQMALRFLKEGKEIKIVNPFWYMHYETVCLYWILYAYIEPIGDIRST